MFGNDLPRDKNGGKSKKNGGIKLIFFYSKLQRKRSNRCITLISDEIIRNVALESGTMESDGWVRCVRECLQGFQE